MKSLAVLVTALGLAAGSLAVAAPAPDYTLVGASSREVWYVDAASMKRADKVTGFDVLSIQEHFPVIQGRQPVLVVLHHEVNCEGRLQRETMMGAFDGAGQPIAAKVTPDVAWAPVVSESLGSSAFDFVCLGKLRADQTNVRGASALQIARTAAAHFASHPSAPKP